ncbi:uncharacterized protein LOC106970868 [Acinonyx jubatus]|uniref:Uncharacterized protein LOC106970868 n=1 Tax=Acinonyx jubatus TaxID=32536 RepID=A0ABM3NXN4_ACIJB|nr:uncharacterized protein LOC106970868 [Acinonyx jubatus]
MEKLAEPGLPPLGTSAPPGRTSGCSGSGETALGVGKVDAAGVRSSSRGRGGEKGGLGRHPGRSTRAGVGGEPRLTSPLPVAPRARGSAPSAVSPPPAVVPLRRWLPLHLPPVGVGAGIPPENAAGAQCPGGRGGAGPPGAAPSPGPPPCSSPSGAPALLPPTSPPNPPAQLPAPPVLRLPCTPAPCPLPTLRLPCFFPQAPPLRSSLLPSNVSLLSCPGAPSCSPFALTPPSSPILFPSFPPYHLLQIPSSPPPLSPARLSSSHSAPPARPFSLLPPPLLLGSLFPPVFLLRTPPPSSPLPLSPAPLPSFLPCSSSRSAELPRGCYGGARGCLRPGGSCPGAPGTEL